MSDLPRKAVTRTAKLAALPLSFAGRATWSLGKRIGGRSAELVGSELQQRTAQQLFSVLGELKGGAMKLGQALSVFESALPEAVAGPYRAALTKLQEAAPPLPAATVRAALAERLGPDWRELFREFDERPAAAASIGQVHRAVWRDGREVAVKIQYPGAGEALLSDLSQLGRFVRLLGPLVPGMDMKPLVEELRRRVAEELDYGLEAEAQRRYARAFRGDPDVIVPDVVCQADQVLISEWLPGRPLSEVIGEGSREERDRAGQLLARFLFTGTARTGMLHADTHPGNFRLVPQETDGKPSWKLGVMDFGAVNRLPGGLPPVIGRALRMSLDGRAEEVYALLCGEGFVKPGIALDPGEVLDYLLPIIEPARREEFRFGREWMREQAARIADPRSAAYQLGRRLNLPPSYLLIHRVTLSTIGVLCQLGATVRLRDELLAGLPGFAETGEPAAEQPVPGERTAEEAEGPAGEPGATVADGAARTGDNDETGGTGETAGTRGAPGTAEDTADAKRAAQAQDPARETHGKRPV